MKLIVLKADISNLELLHRMNRELMEDERYDRPPTDEVLVKRWNDFLTLGRYGTFLFKSGSDVIGYAVVHLDDDPLYLRHFYICREHRRAGWGTVCFNALLDKLNTKKIDIEVMSWNKRGMGFWRSLGFTERCRSLSYGE